MYPEATFMSPKFEPYSNSDFDSQWIWIRPYDVEHFTSWGRDESGGVRATFRDDMDGWAYLLPEQILETVNHSWEPWETIASRLAGKGKEAIQMGKQFDGLWRALKSQRSGVDLSKIFTNVSSISKAKWKVDTPLVYEDSERREYTFEFQLVATKQEEANNNIQGVRTLQAMSSPKRYGDVTIELPCVFKVEQFPPVHGNFSMSAMINLPYAALTSIQPTYMAPYKNGYPMRIALTLTFKELAPLYSDSFDDNMGY
jgi:hypothetical protein